LPQVDGATRTLKARLVLQNVGRQLMPGMFLNFNLSSASRHDVLQIPSEAIIQTGTRTMVMLSKSDGHFVPVPIETGRESNGQTEVIKGLESGQQVVISGQFLIDSEASLKGAIARFNAGVTENAGSANTPSENKPTDRSHANANHGDTQ